MFKNNIKYYGLALFLMFAYHNDKDKIVLYVNRNCNTINNIALNKNFSMFYKQ